MFSNNVYSNNAILIGDTVSFEALSISNVVQQSEEHVVGAGNDFTAQWGNSWTSDGMDVDVSDYGITFSLAATSGTYRYGYQKIRVSSLDWVGMPLAEIASITPSFDVHDAIGLGFTFDAHSITLALGNTAFWAGDSVHVDIVTANTGSPTSVSEPGTLVLLALGLSGLIGMRKFKS